jgi:hypothetical protein
LLRSYFTQNEVVSPEKNGSQKPNQYIYSAWQMFVAIPSAQAFFNAANICELFVKQGTSAKAVFNHGSNKPEELDIIRWD